MKRQIYLYSSFFLILIFFGGIFLSGVSFTGRAVDEDCKGSFFECLAKNAKTLEKQNEEKISVEDKLTNNNFFEEQETNIFENDFNSFQYRSRDNMFLGQNDFLLSDRENENFPINKGENIGEYEGYIVEFEEKPLLVLKSDLEEEVSYKKETEAQTKGVSKFILKTFSKDSEILEEEASVKLEKQREILQQTSENFKAKLEEESISREIISEEFYFSFSGVSVGKLTKEEKEKIESMPGIKRVTPNYRVKAFLMDSVSLVEADLVWQISDPNNSSLNLTGEGIKIAIIDTGIDYTHPDLGSCTSSSFLKGKCEKVLGGYDFVNNDFDPMDDNGHGTHCASIAAGKGILKGVAPDAKLYGFKVLSSAGGGDFSDVISAIERSVDLNNNGIPLEDENDYVDIISLSLGGQGNPDDPVSQAIDNVVSAGVIAVIAVGNDGLWNGPIGSPATSRKAISVGASDKNDLMASFSSRGPVLWEDAQGKIKSLSKPDVVAPGDGFFSSQGICAAQWNDAWSDRECIDNQHTSIPGTSMATPHVAGAVALIKQAHPDWSPEEIKMVLKNSAQNLNGAGIKDQGQGRINVRSSLNFSKPLIASLNEIDYLPSGQMNILGSAKGDDFYSYSVFYSSDSNTWNLICSGNNVVDEGVLCSNFDPNVLKEGIYNLKLSVYGNNSIQSKDFGFFKIKNVEILNPDFSEIYRIGDQINLKWNILNPYYNLSNISYFGSTPHSYQGINILNDSFAVWNTSGFNQGYYLLIFSFSSFFDSFSISFPIYLDLTLKEGWPRKVEFQGNSNIRSEIWPVVVDLNRDGYKEILFNSYFGSSLNQQINLLNYEGETLSGWPFLINTSLGNGPLLLTSEDINGDNIEEVLVLISGLGRIYIYAISYNGTLVNYWDFSGIYSEEFSSSLSLADINNDGKRDFVITTDKVVYIFDIYGNSLSGWPQEIGEPNFMMQWDKISYPAIGDLDGDGNSEIVMGFPYYSSSFENYNGIIYVWHHNGTIANGWPQYSENAFLNSPAIGDLDGDGKLEIIMGDLRIFSDPNFSKLYVWNYNGTIFSGWPYTFEENIRGITSGPSVGDLGGDGKLEVITLVSQIQQPYFILYSFDYEGNLIFNKSLIQTGDFSYSSPIIADINGDHYREIIVSGPSLGIYDRFGSFIQSPISGYFFGTSDRLIVSDLDKDDFLDLVLGASYPKTKIYAWNLSVLYNESRIDWPMFMHDLQHTGKYEKNNPLLSPEVQCFSSSLIGDANADGAINSADALLISKVFVQLIPTPNNICCLDVNRDGTINSADSLLVMRYFVGYPNTGYAGQLCSSI